MITGREDIPAMLDSLQELFQEHGDTVTPTLLVSRMEQKLHRRLHMHMVAYLYRSLGFVTKRIEGHCNSYYIIPNSRAARRKMSSILQCRQQCIKIKVTNRQL